jgi:hypothetical protein
MQGEMKMEDKLKDLANKRIQIAEYKARVKDAETQLQQFQPFIHLQNMKDYLKGLEKEEDRLKVTIKQDTETKFRGKEKENKKPYDGLEFERFKVVRILDEREAKKWAATNAPQTLSIEKAPFNKVAKVLELEFIEIYNEWRAQIASDLSMYEELEHE